MKKEKYIYMGYMNSHYYCVIMAGGTANRFWPASREDTPKQFIDLSLVEGPVAGGTLVSETYERCRALVPEENIIVVTLARYRDILKSQIPQLPDDNILCEPYSRKTAPCIAYATCHILKRDPEAVMLVTPSDLLVRYDSVYRDTIAKVLDYVTDHPVLMTLGLTPESPDPNYGYIQVRGGRNACEAGGPVEVKTFTEKPDPQLAEVFCKSGEFYWNSGIFAWRASVIKEEMERYVPEIMSLFSGWSGALGTTAEKEFVERAYTDCAKMSIDHGVMEKSTRVWMYHADFTWTDVNSWAALYAVASGKDAAGNVTNAGKHLFGSSRGNLVLSQKPDKLIAVEGLEDYMVIDTDDVLLVCPRDSARYREFITGIAMPGYEDYK